MELQTRCLGPFFTNCFLLTDERRCWLVDPANEPELLCAELAAAEAELQAILLTHAHIDHISALPELHRRFAVPVYMHAAEARIYHSRANAFPPLLPALDDLPETSNAWPDHVAGQRLQVLETPGHTPGGVSLYFPDAAVVIAGDTLFQSSVGRTDLPGGDWDTLERSIRDVLYRLPDATVVHPGHGPATTIAREKAGNPFVSV